MVSEAEHGGCEQNLKGRQLLGFGASDVGQCCDIFDVVDNVARLLSFMNLNMMLVVLAEIVTIVGDSLEGWTHFLSTAVD